MTLFIGFNPIEYTVIDIPPPSDLSYLSLKDRWKVEQWKVRYTRRYGHPPPHGEVGMLWGVMVAPLNGPTTRGCDPQSTR